MYFALVIGKCCLSDLIEAKKICNTWKFQEIQFHANYFFDYYSILHMYSVP